MMYEWDWEGAEQAFHRALELDPRSAIAHGYSAVLLQFLGRTDEAIASASRAADLEPVSPYVLALSGLALFMTPEVEQSIRLCEESLAIEQDYYVAMWVLGGALNKAGRPEEAIDVLARAAEVYRRHIFILPFLANALASAGRGEEAREVLAEMEQRSSSEYVSPALLFPSYHWLGDVARARELAEKAYEQRFHSIGYFYIAKQPVFPDILRRMGLPW
jgi:pentatricopeptide repeat protein